MAAQDGKLKTKISLSGGSPSASDAMQAATPAQDAGTSFEWPSPNYDAYDAYDGVPGDGTDYQGGFDYRDDYQQDQEVPQYDDVPQDDFPQDATAAAATGYGATSKATKSRKKAYKRASIVFLGIFIISGTLLALMLGTKWLKAQAYSGLAANNDMAVSMADKTVATDDLKHEETPSGRDWAGLIATNGDIKYWMNVENKPIDYPLVQHQNDQNYYLKHDFWGGYDIAGTPFIDVRNFLTDKHLLTYGHHITGSETMYSTVNKAWNPDEFAQIGKLTLEAPVDVATGKVSYEIFYPAFAFMVDQSYQTIQTFEFESDAQFRVWLTGMANEATATNEYTEYLCRNARRAVTFVTCASDTPNQRERTLVVFVSVAAPSTSYEDANFLPQDIAEVTAQQQAAAQAQQTAQIQQAQQQATSPTNPQMATGLVPLHLLNVGTTALVSRIPSSPLLDAAPGK